MDGEIGIGDTVHGQAFQLTIEYCLLYIATIEKGKRQEAGGRKLNVRICGIVSAGNSRRYGTMEESNECLL